MCVAQRGGLTCGTLVDHIAMPLRMAPMSPRQHDEPVIKGDPDDRVPVALALRYGRSRPHALLRDGTQWPPDRAAARRRSWLLRRSGLRPHHAPARRAVHRL